MDNLRQYNGKHMVSFLRQTNCAHAGEDEATLLVMKKITKNKEQLILDVGCGLGGTAHFIQNNGWGKLTGIDIEEKSIIYAKKTYPEIIFHTCDMLQVHLMFTSKFDVICLFNSLYAVNDHNKALNSLYHVAKYGSKLAIFDYSDLYANNKNPLLRIEDNSHSSFVPINLKDIDNILTETGWNLIEKIDIRSFYIKWYENLIWRLLSNKKKVINLFGNHSFEEANTTYNNILNATKNGILGGIIIYAEKISSSA